MGWQAQAMSRIKALVAGAQWTPDSTVLSFDHVQIGEPGEVNWRRSACFWYAGESELGETLGNVMRVERFPFRGYWQLADGTPEGLERVEIEIVEANAAVKAALNGERGLSLTNMRNVTCTPGQASVGYVDLALGGGQVGLFRELLFDLLIENLEGEDIAR